jgi:hypothetical protein
MASADSRVAMTSFRGERGMADIGVTVI